MAHELRAEVTRRLFTDGCWEDEPAHYLDGGDPDDAHEYLRTLFANQVENHVRAYVLWHMTFPTFDETLELVGRLMPKRDPRASDCAWALSWVINRPGSRLRIGRMNEDRVYRCLLDDGEDC
jgi:hypothetical protein